MAEIYSYPNNQDEYIGAEEVMRWHHGRTSGVYGADNNCAVTASDGAMAVRVSDGYGWISNNENNGVVWWNYFEKNNGYPLTLEIDGADATLNRIDRVVVSWETTNYVARPTIEILKGTFSSTPKAPALTNNNTIRQISLAQIAVNAGAIAITPNMITDERLDPSVCGIVTEQVSIDTSDLNLKYLAALAEMRKAIEEAWDGEIPTGSVSTTFTATIGTNWSNTAPYTQNVSVPGILASDRPHITPVYSDNNETAIAQKEAWSAVSMATAANDVITFKCFEDKPETAIPIFIEVVRK